MFRGIDFFFLFQGSDRAIHLKGLDGDRGDQYNFSSFFSDGKRQTGTCISKYSVSFDWKKLKEQTKSHF